MIHSGALSDLKTILMQTDAYNILDLFASKMDFFRSLVSFQNIDIIARIKLNRTTEHIYYACAFECMRTL